jgi:hypothetical protein
MCPQAPRAAAPAHSYDVNDIKNDIIQLFQVANNIIFASYAWQNARGVTFAGHSQQGMYTFAKCSYAIRFCSEIAYLYGHATSWYYVDICVVLQDPQVPDRNGQRWYQLAELKL